MREQIEYNYQQPLFNFDMWVPVTNEQSSNGKDYIQIGPVASLGSSYIANYPQIEWTQLESQSIKRLVCYVPNVLTETIESPDLIWGGFENNGSSGKSNTETSTTQNGNISS